MANAKCPRHQLKFPATKRSNVGQRSLLFNRNKKREHKTPRLMIEPPNKKSQHKVWSLIVSLFLSFLCFPLSDLWIKFSINKSSVVVCVMLDNWGSEILIWLILILKSCIISLDQGLWHEYFSSISLIIWRILFELFCLIL